LFYLMEVEGLFLPNVDTEKGVAVHKRVDRASAAVKETDESDDPEKPKSVRSLVLSSAPLGLTAKLDLAEITGKQAVPVEYRKGRPKHATLSPPPDDPEDAEIRPLSHPEPWPTDRAQVGFQTLLLKEAGYEVAKAVLYYAAEKTRLELPVDAALETEALAVLAAAKACAAGPRPLPLVNDARCIRCSLQPLCLPDEVNQQRAEPEECSPRKIWPPRDDGIHVIAQKQGIKIGVSGMSVKVTDKNGVKVQEIPITQMESLSVLGAVQLSTQALQALADRGIPVAFLSGAGRLLALVEPHSPVSAVVRRAQVLKLEKPQAKLELAHALVGAKISNQRRLLTRNHPAFSENLSAHMADEAEKSAKAESLDAVRGHEGQAAAIYFKVFAGMFKTPLAAKFDENGRKRRPPPDPLNACLSFAYAMLANECTAALRLAGLEPVIGAYHVARPGRPALALDLMEPFRPLIADSVVLSAFNRGELAEGHFQQTSAGCVLTDVGRRAFFAAYGRRLDDVVTHPVFEYRLSYRRMLVLHARMIAAWLTDEIPSLAFLTTR
jgi:CRISPR-associated protein Cas1